MVINGRYFIDDPESGYYEVDKYYYEQFHKRIQEFFDTFIKPNLDLTKSRKGSIIITSTLADDNSGNEFYKQLWKTKE